MYVRMRVYVRLHVRVYVRLYHRVWRACMCTCYSLCHADLSEAGAAEADMTDCDETLWALLHRGFEVEAEVLRFAHSQTQAQTSR